MRSKEYVGLGFYEGFAHFYAADVWNDDDEADCSFRYYKNVAGAKRTVDCLDGNTYFPQAYLENQCASGGLSGRGVELDWLRAFWFVHTNGSAPDPSFNSIIAWIDDGTDDSGWHSGGAYEGAYEVLDDVVPGGDLGSNWDDAKVDNGIDH